jgi:hypothetical protein
MLCGLSSREHSPDIHQMSGVHAEGLSDAAVGGGMLISGHK